MSPLRLILTVLAKANPGDGLARGIVTEWPRRLVGAGSRGHGE